VGACVGVGVGVGNIAENGKIGGKQAAPVALPSWMATPSSASFDDYCPAT